MHPPSNPSEKGRIEYLAKPLDAYRESKTRFNDGACDAKGRFIAGTLSVEDGKGGSLWSYGVGDEGVRLVDGEDISVSMDHDIHETHTKVLIRTSTGLERARMDSRQQDNVLYQLQTRTYLGL